MKGMTAVKRGMVLICFGLLATPNGAWAVSFNTSVHTEATVDERGYGVPNGFVRVVDSDIDLGSWGSASATSQVSFNGASAMGYANVVTLNVGLSNRISLDLEAQSIKPPREDYHGISGYSWATASGSFSSAYYVASDYLPAWAPVRIGWSYTVRANSAGQQENVPGSAQGYAAIMGDTLSFATILEERTVSGYTDTWIGGMFSPAGSMEMTARAGSDDVWQAGWDIDIWALGSLTFEVNSLTNGAYLLDHPPVPTPLPPSVLLLGSGLAGLGGLRSRRRKTA